MEDFEELTQDAKIVFGSLIGSKTEVRFEMRESRPTKRCQAALDELWHGGLISKEVLPFGGIIYRPVDRSKSFDAFIWLGKNIETLRDEARWPLTEKI